jgi:hypothetical protein
MKITVGHIITLAFLAFGGFIMYMISKMLNTNVDLVEKDYYAQELKFQDKINKYKNTIQLGDSAVIVQQNDKDILIQIKNNLPEKISVMLYYPANAKFDTIFVFNNENKIRIDKNMINKGRTKIKVEWNYQNAGYYFEKELLIY